MKVSKETRKRQSVARKNYFTSLTSAERKALYSNPERSHKISEARKKIGTPWWKGKHLTKKTKDKISKANTGKKRTLEAKLKLSLSHKGIGAWNKGLSAPWATGKKSNFWKGGITPINKTERARFKRTMQSQVFKRDNYKCVFCGKGGILQVDHIQPWAEYVEGRFDMNNCRTLCEKCHYKITFGKAMPVEVKRWGRNFRKGGYSNSPHK